MALTSGTGALVANDVAKDILDHLTPNSGTTATAITITGPIKCALIVGASTNTTLGAECSDANYARQSISWGADAVTSGAGYGVGYVQKANTVALTFGGAGGFAVAQTIYGVAYYSSDATPVLIAYENYAATVSVGVNQQYIIPIGSATIAQS